MKASRFNRYSSQAWVTLALGAGTLGLGSLSQPEGPIWSRWLALAAVQAALGGLSGAFCDFDAVSLQWLVLKSMLWPALMAGMAGAAQLMGIETFAHAGWLAIVSLALAHALGECFARGGGRAAGGARAGRPVESGAWLLDARWLLAIAGVPWIWGLVSGGRLAELMLAGGLFFWLTQPSADGRPGRRPMPASESQ